ncbi:MAG: phosphoribosylformylglycinamidine cyclo-ligase [Eggerthellaceae bacterium]|nr:phosphoribosylformylglycinamidine cyclo-ligase [Eggerthellaceae bacterium]
MANEPKKTTYADAGVDIDEGARAVEAIRDIVHTTYTDEVIGDIGGFGGLFSIARAKSMEDPVLVSGTDGVGTKLKIAQMLRIHNTVGIDLVAMCANDLLATGAKPLFFLDYIAAGKIESDVIAKIVEGIAEGCRQAGCALIGGEMAEHPGVMDEDDYDLSGFCTGIVDRPKMLDPESVVPGDVLIGLPSSGLHSNGYSLVRKVLTEGRDAAELSAPSDELDGKSLADALLEPTRIYVDDVMGVMEGCPGALRSLAHITGGGITENLNRAINDRVDADINLGSWPVPPVIRMVCEAAGLDEDESLKTFNMGLGLILVVDLARVSAVCVNLVSRGEKPYLIGSVAKGNGRINYLNKGHIYDFDK